MPDSRAQALSRALLHYLVVDLRAQAGAVFSVSQNTPPFRVAQTERFDQRGDTRNPQRAQIEAALAASRGVVAQAARLLGRPSRTLWDQIRRLDIDPRTFKRA